MKIPSDIEAVITVLTRNGYEAYAVGGCVRDMLRGEEPHDYDITTSAPPEEMIRLFEKTVPTGIRHGTVTVLTSARAVEVTTYRSDGEYRDHRRPEQVTFVKTLREDLARRDFTVNAMAYHPEAGLQDPFGGNKDLQNRLLRAVGDPKKRFEEDALRILRLFRFASVLQFQIEPATLKAALQCADLLQSISAERIREELRKAVAGKQIESFSPLITCGGLAFLGLKNEPDYRLITALRGESDIALFAFFHSAGADALHAFTKLKASNAQKAICRDLAFLLSSPLPQTKAEVKERLYRTSPAAVERYFRYLCAEGKDCEKPRRLLAEIAANQEPYRICDLKIGGTDLKKLGIEGEKTGQVLEALRQMVVEQPEKNRRSALLEAAKNFI